MADVSLQGKTALVTGATNGIGKVAATELARRGATVVIVGRDAQRTADAVTEISARSGSKQVSALLGDLSAQQEVKRVAAEFKASHTALHILLNNAGALFHDRQVTADGFEMTFALNHLAYFTLTHALLDLLKQSAPARIVSVASEAHRQGRIDFDDLQFERGYSRFSAYGRSKLANILFTRELARKLAGTGVTANCVHPGVVATGFGSGKGFLAGLIKLVQPLMLSPEQGADTLVWLCTSPEVEGQSGGYYAKRKLKNPTSAGQDDGVAGKLWTATQTLTGLA
jgi:NAD(P)-dependent dehydrogenase (short-subunit alcohol dehydrogenase family)